MIVDARSLPAGQELSTEICIIGAGPAGITLAREFAGGPMPVCLLESGGFEPDAETQDLYAGEVTGHHYQTLDTTRLRFFGGTSNHWAGYCRPMDDIDFATRPWLPDTGWPLDRAALNPYYRRAQPICELGRYDYEPENWRDGAYGPFAFDAKRLISGVIQVGPPTRFGEVYREAIHQAKNITAYLNANVTDIRLTDERATEVRVSCLDGKSFTVKAAIFILATGSIENARILLYSNSQRPAGIGNTHDVVGRYFSDHFVVWESGQLVTDRRYKETMLYGSEQRIDDAKIIGFVAPSDDFQREQQIPNCAMCLDPVNLSVRSSSIASVKHVLRAVEKGQIPDQLATHIGRMISNFDDLVDAAYRKAMKPPPKLFTTRFWTECPPDPASRVMLADEKDALGLPRVKLDLRLPADLPRTFNIMHELFATEIGRLGIGRTQIGLKGSVEAALEDMEGSFHQMGTTRMHPDPRKGVVDINCRVHDVHNLFIAGSSVFPAYGHINPTLTIVALATRLADHVKQLVRASAPDLSWRAGTSSPSLP
jgi:choline dehydrogenase-like flavoprotein